MIGVVDDEVEPDILRLRLQDNAARAATEACQSRQLKRFRARGGWKPAPGNSGKPNRAARRL